ncbi:hypothetical protein JXI42_09845 [bacterium]|nr:hypothetical protein [bacterium]
MKAILKDKELLIVKDSLRREISLSKAKLQLVSREIEQLEKKYGMSSKSFMKKFDEGSLGDDQDYFEWWGLVKGMLKLKENIDKMKAVLQY